MFDLASLLKLLPVVGPVIAAAPEFKSIFDTAVSTLHPKDQATAKAALEDIIADNDDGHARLQAKLAEAANR